MLIHDIIITHHQRSDTANTNKPMILLASLEHIMGEDIWLLHAPCYWMGSCARNASELEYKQYQTVRLLNLQATKESLRVIILFALGWFGNKAR